ncbi:MAG: sensor histidine kinase [Candidatus Entotheonellia bacterium]
MSGADLAQKIEAMEEQIAGLQRRISLLPAQQTPLTPDAFDELLHPFAILQAVAQELRSQGAALQAQESFLRAQTAVAEVALSTLQPAILAPRLLAAIARAQGYSFGFLWRVSEDDEEAILVASFGEGLAPFRGERRPLDRPGFLAGQTIRSGQPTYRNHLLVAQDDNPQTKRMVDAQALLALPLIWRTGHVVGCLVFADCDNPARFTEHDLAQGVVLASQVAQALENGDLFSQVERLKEAFERKVEERTLELQALNARLLADVAQRTQVEEQLQASLQQKEVLLKEIHHRVKNNLQVICSLLTLQADSIRDPQALAAFQDSQHRIRSMALIHEKLYQSENLARIDFAEYIRNLTTHLFHSYRVDSNLIALKIDLAEVFLSVDTAIPCGLIINELVSNCLKHAFLDGRSGEIHVALRVEPEEELTLVIGDNGIGFPTGLDFHNTPSLGLQLVRILTEQLDGTLTLEQHAGMTVTLTFAEPPNKVRYVSYSREWNP